MSRCILFGRIAAAALAVWVVLPGCKNRERDRPRHKPKPLVKADASIPVRNTDFKLLVSAYVTASYNLGYDKKLRIKNAQIYSSGVRDYVFPAGKPAVARFPLGDGRAVDMLITDLHRIGTGLNAKGRCTVRNNWMFRGMGRAENGCGIFRAGTRRFPLVQSIRHGPSEKVELHVLTAAVLPLKKPPSDPARPRLRAGTKTTDRGIPARVITEQEVKRGSWKTDGGHWKRSMPNPPVKPCVARRNK